MLVCNNSPDPPSGGDTQAAAGIVVGLWSSRVRGDALSATPLPDMPPLPPSPPAPPPPTPQPLASPADPDDESMRSAEGCIVSIVLGSRALLIANGCNQQEKDTSVVFGK